MARIDTTCPECGAPHAKKLSVIYEEGFSTVQTDINTVGTFQTIGRQKIKTKGTSSSVEQTQASKDAAPPVVPKFVSEEKAHGIGLIVVGLIFVLFGLYHWLFFIAAAASIAVGIVKAMSEPKPEEIERYNNETRTLRHAADTWADTFQCGACSYRFVPTKADAA